MTKIGVLGMPISSTLTSEPQIVWAKPSRKKKIPMVAMKRMMCGWLTSGRSTTRSTEIASSTMMPAVMKKAMVQCSPSR